MNLHDFPIRTHVVQLGEQMFVCVLAQHESASTPRICLYRWNPLQDVGRRLHKAWRLILGFPLTMVYYNDPTEIVVAESDMSLSLHHLVSVNSHGGKHAGPFMFEGRGENIAIPYRGPLNT